MKKLLGSMLGIAVFALTIVANVASASACWFGHYQPEVPQSLRK